LPIKAHPSTGTILTCNFDEGFKQPEMVKRRPVVVISPQNTWRPGLCTVVALSTTPPNPKRPYHCVLKIEPLLPPPWDSHEVWVKGDMILAVAYHRLDFIRIGRDGSGGRRLYYQRTLTVEQINQARSCVLHSLGLFKLTKHL
jgi:mRNA interferase MazF